MSLVTGLVMNECDYGSFKSFINIANQSGQSADRFEIMNGALSKKCNYIDNTLITQGAVSHSECTNLELHECNFKNNFNDLAVPQSTKLYYCVTDKSSWDYPNTFGCLTDNRSDFRPASFRHMCAANCRQTQNPCLKLKKLVISLTLSLHS